MAKADNIHPVDFIFTAQIVRNGAVTIPKHVRVNFNLEEGDSVVLSILQVQKKKVQS